jgi:enoyl-CoA hydratase/carnithine racemase
MNAPLDTALQPFVLSETRDGVATLTLNRGDRFNPLSQAMVAALQAELDRIAADSAVRAVVIAGSGKGFCAGHDLKELRAHSEPRDSLDSLDSLDSSWQQNMFDACSRMMLTLTLLPQPVIARVHGIATAAGCQLVSMCDLAVAAENARFALPGVNVGIFCTTPAVGVARNIGRKRAMEMLLTGEMISARTALDWGLVNKVVEEAELDAAISRFTGIIRNRSAAVVALGKRAFYRQIECDIEGAYALAGGAMAGNMIEPDAREGIDAFLGKRTPKWGG